MKYFIMVNFYIRYCGNGNNIEIRTTLRDLEFCNAARRPIYRFHFCDHGTVTVCVWRIFSIIVCVDLFIEYMYQNHVWKTYVNLNW